jgi:hypothetical protein
VLELVLREPGSEVDIAIIELAKQIGGRLGERSEGKRRPSADSSESAAPKSGFQK